VILAIDDSGPGIAAEIASRLFTPYVTTKGSRGTGLGLALVHRIVAEHGGTIEAGRSAILPGARFVVRLPLHPSGQPPPPGLDPDHGPGLRAGPTTTA
jgi:two-component system sensor histidine kinase AtoS